MTSIQEIYVKDVDRLNKVVKLQDVQIKDLHILIESKDRIIAILMEQKQILVDALNVVDSSISKSLELH